MAAVRCSQLSSTISTCRSPRCSAIVSVTSCPSRSCAPRPPATVSATIAGSSTGASSTQHTPWENEARAAPATASASRVLPVPPGPVRVSKRLRGQGGHHVAELAAAVRPSERAGTGSRPVVSDVMPRAALLLAGHSFVNPLTGSPPQSWRTRANCDHRQTASKTNNGPELGSVAWPVAIPPKACATHTSAPSKPPPISAGRVRRTEATPTPTATQSAQMTSDATWPWPGGERGQLRVEGTDRSRLAGSRRCEDP